MSINTVKAGDFLKSELYDDRVHTYNNEPASEFGLEGKDAVLCYSTEFHVWYASRFDTLEKGDQWRKQLPAPLTDEAVKQAVKDNPHPLCFGSMEELRDGWQFMSSRIEQHAIGLERQLAEALEQNRVFRIAQKACVDCEGMSHIEFQECKKDTERLDWLEDYAYRLEVYGDYPHVEKIAPNRETIVQARFRCL